MSTPHPHQTLLHRLGHAGLIPFVMLAAMVWLLPPDLRAWTALALAAYAALVLSFLGGLYWGALWGGATGNTAAVWWGVTPSLLAWPGVLMPPHAGLAWLGFLLVLCYGVDRRLFPTLGLSPWLTLRFRLSTVAALSCFLAAGAI